MKVICEKEGTLLDGEGSELLKIGKDKPAFTVGGSHKIHVKNMQVACFETEKELLIYRINFALIPKWKKWIIRNVL